MPAPVRFSWKTEDDDALFTLWECNNDGTLSTILEQCGGSEAQIYNLKPSAAYCWRVGLSEMRSFRVEDAVPRLLYVDGISNVRDLRGYQTEDGSCVRQGMLIRGTESDLRIPITEEGKRTMREVLGIRTELDLRYPEDIRDRTTSVLGEDIRLDYEMTTCSLFGRRSYETSYMAEFLDELNRFPGDTFRDRVCSFLYRCGISSEILHQLKAILLT